MGLLIVVGILVVLIFMVVGLYNSFIQLKNMVEESFATIDVYLKKRYDLLPNLVSTVKGYAKHESETLEKVIQARNNYVNAKSIDEKVNNENVLTGALSKLFALSEAYPDLKANQNFITLMSDIRKIEEDLAQARKYYNAVVKNFNIKCETFPSVIIAKMLNFNKYPYFEIKNEQERENVKVEF
ncbi:MAG: LemA family protein [Fusobacteriaceae bacterium]